MIFLNCKNEIKVQTNDKTRIDVSGSFHSGSPITSLLVKPEASGSFISVFNADQKKWFLDWAYSTDGMKTISVQASDGTDTYDADFSISVVTAADDLLYSNDAMLFTIESELKNYIAPGRNSYLNIHREAQARILDFLDRKRIWNSDGTRITKDQLNLNEDLQRWATYETMNIIYEDLVVSVGDKFKEKASKYEGLRNYARDAGAIRIDLNKDEEIEVNEIKELKSFQLLKR